LNGLKAGSGSECKIDTMMNLKTLAFALLAAAMRAALGAFPRGSCPAQPCDWSPYNFMWTNVTPGSFCFNVVPAAAGCEGPCCATFENLLMKFVVNTVPDCKTAFKQVNINGVRKGGLDRKTLLIAIANACVIALYTIVDGTGGRLSGHSISYNIWLEFLDGVLFVPAALFVRGKPLAMALMRGWKIALLGGGAAFASYGIAIWAMTEAPIGLVAAVRESSVFFATVFGALFLGEKFGRSRYIAAVFVAVGLAALRFG
ncbi:MAG: hypothetical protein EBU34_09160, partial [Alphaproteobacteria bacterium]|nr:hypothetical protein [Alphaproteobacteria bacterium]